jgi:endonuclease/exonuclease/phosphatase family metal-dependent hydrolase
MKVISLNTWGGKAGLDELLAFLKRHEDVDVFCLQEVWSGNEDMVGVVAGPTILEGVSTRLLYEIEEALPGYRALYRPYFRGAYGVALFVKREHEVLAEGESYIYREPGFISDVNQGDHARILQYATLATPEGPRTIINLHGLWQPVTAEEMALGGKRDNADRLEQSARILAFAGTLDHPYVIIGDFNLFPETESIAMLERSGLRNLVREHEVRSTRTSLYRYQEKNPFADYAFVSEGIDVQDFKVLPDEVSDHSPLYLSFT